MSTVTLGCTLRDPAVLHRVLQVIRQEGGRALALSRDQALAAARSAGLDGLVYDLEPGDLSAVTLVRVVRSARPEWPLWLYYPRRFPMIERATEVGSLPWVWATPQLLDVMGDTELKLHVRRVIAAVPRVQFTHLLDNMLRSLPVKVREFLVVAVEHVDTHRSGVPTPGQAGGRV